MAVLLLEDGDTTLLESGDDVLLELEDTGLDVAVTGSLAVTVVNTQKVALTAVLT